MNAQPIQLTHRPKSFSGSQAAQHMQCHASANLPLAIPGFEYPVRDQTVGAKGAGTQVHKVMFETLLGIDTVTKSRTKKWGAKDMIAFGKAAVYIGEVWSERRFSYLAEHRVMADWLDDPVPTTADLVLYTKDQLEIMDLKWGEVEVPAIDNVQGLYYAASYAYLAPQAKSVRFHIVQPKVDNMVEWVIDLPTLAQFMTDARAAQQAILAGSVTFGPSDECKFCPAYPHSRGDKGNVMCPATLKLLYPRVEIDEADMLAD